MARRPAARGAAGGGTALSELRAAVAASATSAAVGEGAEARAAADAAEARAHEAAAKQHAAEARAAEAAGAAADLRELREGLGAWQLAVSESSERRAREALARADEQSKRTISALRERMLSERASHVRAMGLQQRKASAELQSAREAWRVERRRYAEAALSGGAQQQPPSSSNGDGGGGGLTTPAPHAAMLGGGGGGRGGVAPSPHSLHASAVHLTSENERLHAALAAAQQQLVAAADQLQVRDEALQALEGSALGGAPESGDANGGRRPAWDGLQWRVAALSRQLVDARMAEADARRKLRIATREELSLREELHAHKEQQQQQQPAFGTEVADGVGGAMGGGAGGQRAACAARARVGRARARSIRAGGGARGARRPAVRWRPTLERSSTVLLA